MQDPGSCKNKTPPHCWWEAGVTGPEFYSLPTSGKIYADSSFTLETLVGLPERGPPRVRLI